MMTRAFALTIIIIIAVITLQEVCANKGSWWSRWARSPHTIVTPKDSSNNHGDSSFPQLHSDAAKQLVPWNNLGLPVDDSIDLGIMRIDKRQLGQTFLNLSERIAYLIISTLFARLAVSIIASAVKKLAEKVINELPKDKQIYSHNATSFLKPNSTLNEEEKELLNSITLPEDIKDDWKLIGGLQSVKQGLWDTVQFEMKNISLLASTSSFQRTSKSVLIHGPPGCGKTAIVRGLSKKLGWPLLSIRPSSIMRKYWGESESLVRAIFDLAKKSEHIVIFVDEIESLITSRDNLSTNGNSRILTEFFQAWDDICRTSSSKILLIGVTNRPRDLDPALQRRFDRTFVIEKPDFETRVLIFRKALKAMKKEKEFDFQACARATAGYLSSDIINLCLQSFMEVTKEHVRFLKAKKQQQISMPTENKNDSNGFIPQRPLRTSDVIETAKRSRPLSLAPSFRGDRENAASPRNAENHADNGQGGFWGRNWDEFPANESLDENDGSYDDASTDNDDEEENNNDPQ